MIEISRKLDKSNTELQFRCVIFRSVLFRRTASESDCFLGFSIKNNVSRNDKMVKEGIVVVGKKEGI